MTKSRKSPFEEAQAQIDLRLGGLLGELGSALTEAIEKLDAQGAGEVQTERTFDTVRGPVRASAGIRIRTLGGEMRQETRSPEKPINTPQKTGAPEVEPAQPAHRPIAATILDGSDSWKLIAELPGVDASGVALSSEEQGLTITATGRGRNYQSTFDLPPGATREALSLSVQNGILEITFDKNGTVS